MAKKAKKAEEGEERREEVCEEDSQGFKEEEHEYVISP